MVRIVIGGDVCPMGKVESLFINGDASGIFGDLVPEIMGADLSVVNLECPLVLQPTPIAKPGTVLGAAVGCINGFRAAKWRLVNLGNNHSFDHGARGLRDTTQAIRGAGLSLLGAGEEIQEAQSPFITQAGSKRVVVYSMAEREYSIADEQTPGANPLDIIRCVEAIRVHKQGGVFVVLIHGGLEHFPYPSPGMVRRCRFLVEMGADAVVCCHAHCPLPWETHGNRPIVYGLGNLVFEAMKPMTISWHHGYLAKLIVGDDTVFLEVIPYIQSLRGVGTNLMNRDEREMFLAQMSARCAELQEDALLRHRWREHCRQHREDYLSDLLGHNRVMRRLRRLLGAKWSSDDAVLRALHVAQCETHREVLNTLFAEERPRA